MIRRATTRKGREKTGYFSIEGIRLHERAVRAGVPLQQAIATDRFMVEPSQRVQSLIASLQQQGCQIEIVPDDAIKEIIGDRDLGQILGLIKMPAQRRLEEIVSRNNEARLLLLAAVDVKDPGNVGAMLRTAHASGAAGFVATGISDPYHPKALRTTMGSLFKLPVLYYEDALSLIGELHGLGVEAVGTVARGGVPLPEAVFAASGAAFLLGSEAWGLPEGILSAVDQLVSIPMNGEADSFSVNAAAAIVLYEARRQWDQRHA